MFRSGSLDSGHRTGVDTGTAVGAHSGVDHVLVALLTDGVNGTSICTGSAVDAFVIDCVGHLDIPPHSVVFWITGLELVGVYTIIKTLSRINMPAGVMAGSDKSLAF